MRDALLYGWQRHIVAIGALQVVLIAHHGFVGLALKQDIHALCDILGRETALQFGPCLRHIAHRLCGFGQHNQLSNLALYLLNTHGPAPIDPVGQARLQGIAL